MMRRRPDRAGDAAPRDTITPAERRAIDAAIAEGRLRRIPTGVSGLQAGVAPTSPWGSAMKKRAKRKRARQRNVARLVAEGLSVAQIAERTGWGESTIHQDLQEMGVTR